MVRMNNGEKLMVQSFANSKYKSCSLTELLCEDLKAPMTFEVRKEETPFRVSGDEILFNTMFGALEYRLLANSDLICGNYGFSTPTQLLELEAADSRVNASDRLYAKHVFSFDEYKHKVFAIYYDIESCYRCEVHLTDEEFSLLAELLKRS